MKLSRETVYNFLNTTRWSDSAALFLRIFASVMLLFMHGLGKIQNYGFMTDSFPSVLGMSSAASLVVATIVEVGCSPAVMWGFLTRIALIPLIFTMFTATFIGPPGEFGELPFMYMGIFAALFISGPGAYSFDRLLFVPESVKAVKARSKSTVSE